MISELCRIKLSPVHEHGFRSWKPVFIHRHGFGCWGRIVWLNPWFRQKSGPSSDATSCCLPSGRKRSKANVRSRSPINEQNLTEYHSRRHRKHPHFPFSSGFAWTIIEVRLCEKNKNPRRSYPFDTCFCLHHQGRAPLRSKSPCSMFYIFQDGNYSSFAHRNNFDIHVSESFLCNSIGLMALQHSLYRAIRRCSKIEMPLIDDHGHSEGIGVGMSFFLLS
jgi:hypothetical protein